MPLMPSPVLSLHDLEAFDPQAPASSSERRFLCPLPECGQLKARDAAHRSLALQVSSGLWHCFRCGQGGKLQEHWQERPAQHSKQSRRQSLHRAFALPAQPTMASGQEAKQAFPSKTPQNASQGAGTPSASSQSPIGPQTGSKRDWRAQLKQLRPLSGTPGEAYLLRRGITLSTAQASRVRFCPSWFGRPAVVFPLYDKAMPFRLDVESGGEHLVAAQGRYIDGRDNPKARTGGSRKMGVFATARLWEQVSKGAPIIITEAPIDALSLAECGFPALALCGKDGWPQWLPIRCAFKNVALALDADEAGDAGAQKMEGAFASLGAKVQRLRPEGAKDWNAMLLEQGREALTDYVAQHLL